MGNPAGVKRDFEGLERRRMAAAKLLQQGVSQAEVARRLGVHRQSVIRWVRELRKSGRAGLKQAGRAGRKAKLSAADLQAIEQALKRGPQALGYETALWTAPRVARLIARWSVTKKPSSAGRSTAGPSLKKSPPGGPNHRLRRRERAERATPPLPHLGAARTDSSAAISFQLEAALGDGRDNLVAFLLPALSGSHSRSPGDRVSDASLGPSPGQVAGHLGRPSRSPQPLGPALGRRPAAPARTGAPARLPAGTQPGGVPLGL